MSLVMKFGGTSVGSAEAMQRTAKLIRRCLDAWPEVVVVASAMSGVTDLLLRGANSAAAGDAETYKDIAQALRHKHLQAISELFASDERGKSLSSEIDAFVDRFEALCNAVLVLGELTPRALDAMSSMGERMSIRLLAGYLEKTGLPAKAVDATELVVTDENFQAAAPLMEPTVARVDVRLRPLLVKGIVPVITGFVGATESGVITTLGRGGSDYSAAIIGQALKAQEVWIWTDVDGVMSADPRLVPGARTIASLSYREVAELAYYGAKVLHPKTIRPVVENDIPLRIKNTFNPEYEGTLIVAEATENSGAIKAVTAITGLSLIIVEGKGMIGVPGIAARTFGAVARGKDSVLLITQASSEQSICFAIPDDSTERVISGLEAEFANELGRRDIDRIWAQRPVAIVTAVGAGIRGTPGIAGRIFGELGDRRVNVIAIAQGSSECSVSMVVDGNDAAEAELAIHRLIL
jgi:aspartokinase/homoserine dehydrogenase 1